MLKGHVRGYVRECVRRVLEDTLIGFDRGCVRSRLIERVNCPDHHNHLCHTPLKHETNRHHLHHHMWVCMVYPSLTIHPTAHP